MNTLINLIGAYYNQDVGVVMIPMKKYGNHICPIIPTKSMRFSPTLKVC